MQSPTPSKILKKTRLNMNLSQKEFGKQKHINKSQSEISRYEKGKATPPIDIYMHCMHILSNQSEQIDIDELIMKFKLLKGDKYKKARISIKYLLDSLIDT